MSEPYYADDRVTLYHGRCEDVLPTLDPGAAHLLLTDPPYFQVKDDEWDNQWKHATQFLGWLGDVLDAAKPALTANASAWVFAGPALASKVEGVVGERFRVLNHVRWVKEQGWHQKAEIEAQRRYLTPWEGIIFAEQFADEYEDAAKALHKQVFAPLGRYLTEERERAGLSMNDVDVALGYVRTKNPERGTELCRRWEEGSSLPTERDYLRMREVLNGGLSRDYAHLRREYEDLRREYEDLRREYEDLRRPFNVSADVPYTDVWTFPTVGKYSGKHPCEKPLAMMEHIVAASSRAGAVVLDPFMGSGATGEAALRLGRKFLGIEADVGYFRGATERLENVIDPRQRSLFG